LKEKGFDVNLPQLSVEITERDARDSQRTVSPLRPADDAAVIDTTHLNIEDVIDRVKDLVRDRFPGITEKSGKHN
jgi:cytidylate kinase